MCTVSLLRAVLLAMLSLSVGTGASAQASSAVSYSVEEGFGSGSTMINAQLTRPPVRCPRQQLSYCTAARGPAMQP